MWTIYLKELLELTRDRKTLIFTVLIPIFAMPLIFGGFAYVSSNMSKKAQTAELTYALFGKDNAPALSQLFTQDTSLREVALGDTGQIRQAIDDGRIKFAVVIAPEFDSALQQQRQASIALHHNSASDGKVTQQRVAALIERYNASLREGALAALNLNRAQLQFALNPVSIEQHTTAGQREQMGALIGGILPYLLLMVCLTAAMYPAIDLGAGEKERGTLETLLLAPVPRGAIVLAKFLVLFSVGMLSALLMVASLATLLTVFGSSLEGGLAALVRSIGPLDLAMVALMLVPTAAIFASVLLCISIYAKSYKEAAGMITPLMIVTILPTLVAMLPGVKLNWFWAMVPLTNVSLAIKELVKGTMDYRLFSAILLSTTLIAGALLLLCRWWFNREEVLFRN